MYISPKKAGIRTYVGSKESSKTCLDSSLTAVFVQAKAYSSICISAKKFTQLKIFPSMLKLAIRQQTLSLRNYKEISLKFMQKLYLLQEVNVVTSQQMFLIVGHFLVFVSLNIFCVSGQVKFPLLAYVAIE